MSYGSNSANFENWAIEAAMQGPNLDYEDDTIASGGVSSSALYHHTNSARVSAVATPIIDRSYTSTATRGSRKYPVSSEAINQAIRSYISDLENGISQPDTTDLERYQSEAMSSKDTEDLGISIEEFKAVAKSRESIKDGSIYDESTLEESLRNQGITIGGLYKSWLSRKAKDWHVTLPLYKGDDVGESCYVRDWNEDYTTMLSKMRAK